MAPLAHTLALLAMTVAAAAIEVKLLDMAQDSFDDQYQGCDTAMTTALPALNRSEFQENPLFAQVWAKATAEWQSRGSRVSPLASPAQAIAVMACTMNDLHKEFNYDVQVTGRSPQQYRDNFHFKTLHFLLTDTLATLRDTQKEQCQDVFRGVCRLQFKAQHGDTIRFGRFTSTSLNETIAMCHGTDMIFQVCTCHGRKIQEFSYHPGKEEVVIPPFETFEVTNITEEGKRAWIWFSSTGTFSNYSCEWLQHDARGGSVPRVPFHLGGLLLAATALAVATGIL